MPRTLLILLTLLTATTLNAQRDIKFTRLNIEDGLSQNSVNCIFQDSRGFMWFGTYDGLNKYDGYSFTVYRNDPGDENSISENRVITIMEDKSGMLWIGTQDGLNKFDPKTGMFTQYLHDPQDEHSISNNHVLRIIEDRNGMLWIGAWNGGLDKLNTKTGMFTQYLHDPQDEHSISNNHVNTIIEDRNGMMWFGTWGGGLNKFDPKTGMFNQYLHDPQDEHSISSDSVITIMEDRNGMLWFGTARGLNKLDPKTGKFTQYLNDPQDEHSISNNYANRIMEDRNGMLWIGTNAGLNRFDPKTGKFTQYLHDPQDEHSISDNRVRTIMEDRNDMLWIGTQGGLNKFDPKTGRFTQYLHDPRDEHSISNDVISQVFEDKHGAIWINNTGQGVNKYAPAARKFTHYQNDPYNKNTLSMDYVYSIIEDKHGAIWLAGAPGKLNKLDRKTGKFTHFKHDPQDPHSHPSSQTWAMLEDRHGTLWIGNRSEGLGKLNRATGRFTFYRHNPQDEHSISSDGIMKIYEDKSGVLWIGTNTGLNMMVPGNVPAFIRYTHNPRDEHSISNGVIHMIFEDRLGILWVGAGGTLNKLDRQTGRFTHYRHDPKDEYSISNNSRILSMYEDERGHLWIGSQGGGLNKFDRDTEKFTRWGTKDGLPNNVVYGILADDSGNLWLSTNKGLSRFTPPPVLLNDSKETSGKQVGSRQSAVGNRGVFRNYDVSDGLQSNEFNTGAYMKSKSGEMFFGGVNGFNVFFPDEVTDNPHVPDVVISRFEIFNRLVTVIQTLPNEIVILNGSQSRVLGKEPPTPGTYQPDNRIIKVDDKFYLPQHITYTKEIILSYKESVFSFEFTALHYDNSARNQYAYMMEGVDKGWNYVGTRRNATYTNLDPGEYTFKVKASNSDGIWNYGGTSIRIIITPPFWQTWWFRILSLVIVLLIIFGYIKIRERDLKRERRILKEKVRHRTKQLSEKNKEITDSIHYAHGIQEALLPADEEIKELLPDSFVLFKPKDIVSGDFYWMACKKAPFGGSDKGDVALFAACDCTGHGVPGAFMSMISTALLNEAVNEKGITQPSEILYKVREGIITSLKQTGEAEHKDGMDAAVCTWDKKHNILEYAGANNPLFIIRENGTSLINDNGKETSPIKQENGTSLYEIKPDKQPVGYEQGKDQPFTNHKIQLQKGDTVYIFSDGYQDQFGGPRGKKFMSKRFRQLFLDIQEMSMEEQKEHLNKTFEEWKGDEEQVDDILVIGVKV